MHQIVSSTTDSARCRWVPAIVVAAQFMFGVDAFIVNVAIPTIAIELRASSAQIEAVIAACLIADATLAVTGGPAALALFALSILMCVAFLAWMRRSPE